MCRVCAWCVDDMCLSTERMGEANGTITRTEGSVCRVCVGGVDGICRSTERVRGEWGCCGGRGHRMVYTNRDRVCEECVENARLLRESKCVKSVYEMPEY